MDPTTHFPINRNKDFSSQYEFCEAQQDKGVLGIGSLACVKLAKEKSTGKMVAVKIVDMRSQNMAAHLANLKKEINHHKKLNHPNVIKFYDYFETSTHLLFILEFAQRGTLFKHLCDKQRFSESEAKKIFIQACQAVDYCHKMGVMHRDIKPENILLDKDNNLKLCDFGWSSEINGEKKSTYCGTYEYMAPEMVARRQYDQSVDSWALGILLYELLHGETPFKGSTPDEIARNIVKGEIRLGTRLSSDVKDLIKRILRFLPNERLSPTEMLEHKFCSGIDGNQQSASPVYSQSLLPSPVPVSFPAPQPSKLVRAVTMANVRDIADRNQNVFSFNDGLQANDLGSPLLFEQRTQTNTNSSSAHQAASQHQFNQSMRNIIERSLLTMRRHTSQYSPKSRSRSPMERNVHNTNRLKDESKGNVVAAAAAARFGPDTRRQQSVSNVNIGEFEDLVTFEDKQRSRSRSRYVNTTLSGLPMDNSETVSPLFVTGTPQSNNQLLKTRSHEFTTSAPITISQHTQSTQFSPMIFQQSHSLNKENLNGVISGLSYNHPMSQFVKMASFDTGSKYYQRG